MSRRKILQIMPAPGWGAAYTEQDEELIAPLIGWALVQTEAGDAIVGLVANKAVELCDTQPNFTGYIHLPDALLSALEGEEFDDEFEDEFDDEDGFDDEDESDAPFDSKSGLLN